MEFDPAARPGRTVRTVDVAEAERHRFSLTDDDVLELARNAIVIEKHYGRPMDIEWGKDGDDGKLYILQARPETVKSRGHGEVQQRFRLKGTGRSSRRAAPSARRSASARSASSRTSGRWTTCSRATCSSPT